MLDYSFAQSWFLNYLRLCGERYKSKDFHLPIYHIFQLILILRGPGFWAQGPQLLYKALSDALAFLAINPVSNETRSITVNSTYSTKPVLFRSQHPATTLIGIGSERVSTPE